MIFTLQAESRETIRKSDLTQLRAAGKIPAVIYGKGVDTIKIALSDREFMKCYKQSFTELSFYDIVLDGKKYHTMLKDRQIHPVQRNFLHLDFLAVSEDTTIEVDIPVNYIGEAKGTLEGGFVDILQRTVKVVCKAGETPDGFEIDVTNMEIGDSKQIGDLQKGSWTFKDTDDVAIVVVQGRMAEEVAETAELEEGEEGIEAAEAAEAPEVTDAE
ncbi:MAG: 50S ribosomal protein L25 [Candidatus Cloacimonetes bacterium]|jgi:large subunit ribosomal protein L25|nr:50S ribosomal protein L25 [Candidatus Cloacimonadota bacterium]NLO43915.1 50S ribosomal protein L25 [Candidatus Cloacimonadota bacterium]